MRRGWRRGWLWCYAARQNDGYLSTAAVRLDPFNGQRLRLRVIEQCCKTTRNIGEAGTISRSDHSQVPLNAMLQRSGAQVRAPNERGLVIAVARNDFNDAVQTYNVQVRTFPNNLFAGALGFHPRQGFTADPGSQNAPRVDFPDQQNRTPSVSFDSTKR